MKQITPVIIVAILILLLSSMAMAEEPPVYNFASAQGSKEIKILPGGESVGNIYFYNIDGNRITHITLEFTQAPSGWQVEIQPPLGETQVEVNGQVVAVTENLYVEPSEVQSQEIKDIPEGMVCIPVATRGYALAKEARIIVRVSDSADIGTREAIIISATAQWLGQSGAAAVSQARDFTFTVEVVSEKAEFQEKILGKGVDLGRWLPVIIGAVVVVLGATITLLYIRRKRV
jgi:hypothetical protein